MNLKLPGVKLVPVSGSGPNGAVQITDIRAKLGEIRGEVDETAEQARPAAAYAAVGGVVLLVILAFVLGRRRGRRKSSWVEIRRL
jgi:hypothetical protein